MYIYIYILKRTVKYLSSEAIIFPFRCVAFAYRGTLLLSTGCVLGAWYLLRSAAVCVYSGFTLVKNNEF